MTADIRSPLTKEAGALKEQHEVELGVATPLFDIAYFIYARQILLGIKRRVERTVGQGADSDSPSAKEGEAEWAA